MTDLRSSSSTSQAPPLALPRAVLPYGFSHPDSEDAVRSERYVAQELGPISETDASRDWRLSGEAVPPTSSIRSRGLGLSRQLSQATTEPDSQGPGDGDTRRYRLERQTPHWYDPIVKFWTSQISITIDSGAHRDHLALERTFLGYLRTSLAFAMTGVITAQLFRLQHSPSPSPVFGFHLLGIPLSAVFIGFGMFILLVGAFRFWRQQNAMCRGKVHKGGWEITAIMVGSIVICFVAFVLVTAIDIDKTYF